MPTRCGTVIIDLQEEKEKVYNCAAAFEIGNKNETGKNVWTDSLKRVDLYFSKLALVLLGL